MHFFFSFQNDARKFVSDKGERGRVGREGGWGGRVGREVGEGRGREGRGGEGRGGEGRDDGYTYCNRYVHYYYSWN